MLIHFLVTIYVDDLSWAVYWFISITVSPVQLGLPSSWTAQTYRIWGVLYIEGFPWQQLTGQHQKLISLKEAGNQNSWRSMTPYFYGGYTSSASIKCWGYCDRLTENNRVYGDRWSKSIKHYKVGCKCKIHIT